MTGWAVKVTTLGRFSVRVRGQALAFGRKAPTRPLALLKYLAAHGSREIADTHVANALWPGNDQRALRCLAINLHRLRRLIGSAAILIHRDGHIAIDSRHLWCDAAALERMLDAAARPGHDAQRARLTERALALYRGDFLIGEACADWIVAARERLRRRYVLACGVQAERLAAAVCFQRGLDVDEFAQEQYAGLLAWLRRDAAAGGRSGRLSPVHARPRTALGRRARTRDALAVRATAAAKRNARRDARAGTPLNVGESVIHL